MSSFFSAAGMAYSRSWIVIISEKWVETRIGVTYIYVQRTRIALLTSSLSIELVSLQARHISQVSQSYVNEWMTSGPIHWTPGLPGSDDRNLEMPKKNMVSLMISMCVGQKRFLYEMAQWRETRQWGKCRVGSSGVNIEDRPAQLAGLPRNLIWSRIISS